jgi:hypothetical protein
MFKTHPQITDPIMRRMFAREKRLIRRIARETDGDARAEWAMWSIAGMETMCRRLCNVELVEELRSS